MLPQQFVERLKNIIPGEHMAAVLDCFARQKPLSIRINTLKGRRADILKEMHDQQLVVEPVPWSEDVFVIHNMSREEWRVHPLATGGQLYQQSLSSTVPVIILDPKPKELVLDLCAAPGSKTSQIAAALNNEEGLVALEPVRPRFYKLKAVLSLLGAQHVQLKMTDARKYRHHGGLFDKIIADVPCSSEGRFNPQQKETFAYWSLRKIKELVHKQRGLLLSASRLLKPGGTLVYSTCTFAPEENEGVVDWLLKKAKGQLALEEISVPGFSRYPALLEWEGKGFHPQVRACLRILPDERMEGFFVAKFTKV